MRKFLIEPAPYTIERNGGADHGWKLTLTVPAETFAGLDMQAIGAIIQRRLFIHGIALDQCQIRETTYDW